MALAASITGNKGLFGCDMMEILYNGDVNEGYFQGWRDQVTSKAGYLQTLVNLGVTVQSAYMSLVTDNTQAWTVVQNQYTNILSTMNSRITQFDSKCMAEWFGNTQVNANRILI